MVRQQIRAVLGVQDPQAAQILSEMKTVVETVTGRNQAQIKTLGADATLAGVINKVNELINRMQS